MYFVYMLRCGDDSLYTGTAADWRRRWQEHRERSPRCARYTRSRGAKTLEAVWEMEDKSAALRLEYRIKRLSAEEKRRLISRPESLFEFVPMLSELSCRALPAAELNPAPAESTAASLR